VSADFLPMSSASAFLPSENTNNFSQPLFFNEMRQTSLSAWADELERKSQTILENANHGDFLKWLEAFKAFPKEKNSQIDLNREAITVGSPLALEDSQARCNALKKLNPWRKGPFNYFGIHIDTEWRSHLKWDRVVMAIQPLAGRTVLDLGCGNGYYLWRMAGEGVGFALGVDPSLLFLVQFQVFQNSIQNARVGLLPLGMEDLPESVSGFDTVFSMGLLYHRRDPLVHLKQLFNFLCPGGELVLETLVIEGGRGDVLKPGERYAKMRNVWAIPSCAALGDWLEQVGFKKIRCVDVTTTTPNEQRKTEWMEYESLEDFLDPSAPSKTVEGYPAPKRAIFIAEK